MNIIYNHMSDNNKVDINENSDSSGDIKLKKRKRSTKRDLYKEEREEIIKKLNKILDVEENKNYVYLYDIEHNEEIKKGIDEMSEEVKKYFKTGNWNYYIMKNKNKVPLRISLVRALYREGNIMMTTKEKDILREGKKVRTTLYYLLKI